MSGGKLQLFAAQRAKCIIPKVVQLKLHVDVVGHKLQFQGLSRLVRRVVVGMLITVRELMGTVGGEVNSCGRG